MSGCPALLKLAVRSEGGKVCAHTPPVKHLLPGTRLNFNTISDMGLPFSQKPKEATKCPDPAEALVRALLRPYYLRGNQGHRGPTWYAKICRFRFCVLFSQSQNLIAERELDPLSCSGVPSGWCKGKPEKKPKPPLLGVPIC